MNDAERLSVDPAMRHVVGGRAALTGKLATSNSEGIRRKREILSTGSSPKGDNSSKRCVKRRVKRIWGCETYLKKETFTLIAGRPDHVQNIIRLMLLPLADTASVS